MYDIVGNPRSVAYLLPLVGHSTYFFLGRCVNASWIDW